MDCQGSGPIYPSRPADQHHSERQGRSPAAQFVGLDGCRGTYYLPIKYGRNPIEMQKGMFAIQSENSDHAGQVLSSIKGLAIQGDLDADLEKASSEVRARFTAKSG